VFITRAVFSRTKGILDELPFTLPNNFDDKIYVNLFITQDKASLLMTI